MRKLLSSLFTKEQPWAIPSEHSWQKNDHKRFTEVAHDKRLALVIHSWFKRIAIKNERFADFHCFSPFLCPRANHSCCSLLSHSFLQSGGSDVLTSLFTRVWLSANRSRRFLHKSDPEQFTQVAHDKRANCSFAHKKLANRSKNRCANTPTLYSTCT